MNSRKLIFAIFGLLSAAALLSAHPLGNFSVNQFARIETGSSRMVIRQVLDMAEIPTVAERRAIDIDGDGVCSETELASYATAISPNFLANISVDVDGSKIAVAVASVNAELHAGAGDLSTLRVVWDLTGDLPVGAGAGHLTYRNDNYANRIGWNEIVVRPASGVTVYDSTAFGSGATEELQRYPEDSLASPLAERSAGFSFSTAALPTGAKPLRDRDGKPTVTVQKDRFAELISVPVITPWIAFIGLLAAFGLGAVHAMSPGHGKTVVGAYLVGSKGTPRHALFLGLIVTVTHTLGVFALGLIALFASRYILPERIMPFLGFVSGLLVFFIGLTLFKDRLFTYFGWSKPPHDHHHSGHDEEPHFHDGVQHTHGGSTHSHAMPDAITWRNLIALGVSGGLLPCPSALVLMLSAISMGRIGYGLVLTVAFSFGLAATLTGIGFAFLYIGNVFSKTAFAEYRMVKLLPVMSAFVVASLGAFICYSSLG
jgi:nickel/cobalt transporter (NicO) family protein